MLGKQAHLIAMILLSDGVLIFVLGLDKHFYLFAQSAVFFFQIFGCVFQLQGGDTVCRRMVQS